MALDVERTTVQGRWLRHTPAGADPAVRPVPLNDNRWQRGHVIDALYLCQDIECVWAEWYRHLAERAVPPQRSPEANVGAAIGGRERVSAHLSNVKHELSNAPRYRLRDRPRSADMSRSGSGVAYAIHRVRGLRYLNRGVRPRE